jgi:hypothetical protein
MRRYAGAAREQDAPAAIPWRGVVIWTSNASGGRQPLEVVGLVPGRGEPAQVRVGDRVAGHDGDGRRFRDGEADGRPQGSQALGIFRPDEGLQPGPGAGISQVDRVLVDA